jgi:hypothetical protein
MMKLTAFFSAALLAFSANAASTSKNVDIIVTHPGSLITSYTFINNGGLPLKPGFPVTIGQAFRRGDLLPGQYPLLRDGADHTNLVWQVDEVATRRENSDDKSLRHAAFSFQLPPTSSQYVGGVVPPGGTYKVEFLSQTGAYNAAGNQTLAALCSGGAGAHDLKLRLTDVRNQDDSVRDTGAGTFSICANANNSGRDAPRHLWAGPVLDLYEVRGPLVYDTTADKDPLLYFVCDVYLTTKASDQKSLGDVKWVCAVHNSWMNVTAGSAGNTGSPGPVGFPNDPQAISYRPSALDGVSTVLDWGGLDATVASTSNPIQGTLCGSDYQGVIPACLNVPSSTGQNAWYFGQATRVTSTGTPVGGLTNGGLYYVYNAGSANSGGANTNLVSLKLAPVLIQGGPANPEALILNQGSGTTTFSYRLLHAHNQAWLTLDPSGDENWTSGSARVTYEILPSFTSTEKTYWEETGTVIPMNLAQTGINLGTSWYDGCDLNFHPLGRLNVIGGTQPGPRPDLGLINEYGAQAFIRGNPADWMQARLFTLATTHYAASTMLNEATGRIPALNNGPPTGPAGNGVGTPYSELGVPFTKSLGDTAQALQNVPMNGVDYRYGFWGSANGTYISHEPSFDGLSYLVFGSRHYLDLIYLHSNRASYYISWGPGDSYRDNILDGYHFWGLFLNCCQIRGSAWAYRDKIFAAMLGADGNQESQYNNDEIVENGNYYPHWLSYKDGVGSTSYSTSLTFPNNAGGGYEVDTYIGNYLFLSSYLGQTTLHAPLSQEWLQATRRYVEGILGETASGHLSAFYGIDYSSSPIVHDGDQSISGGGIGQYVNGTDASDFGGFDLYTNILAGGVLQQSPPAYTLQSGDQVKLINGTAFGGQLIDQMPGSSWLTVTGPIDNTAGTYHILCPAGHPVDATCPSPGTGAFTGFTRNGTAIVENGESIIYRPAYDGGGVGYADNNYAPYGGEMITGLHILGYDVSQALSIFGARGGPSYYNSVTAPSQWWDISVIVP